jgi:RHS repeat-associated protein
MAHDSKPQANAEAQMLSPAQAISLPKGGGAIRGIGEKFGANPVTGTGSMSVPIAASPGRSRFGPQLSLGYDSGAGNGPFGFGWSLGLPQISRKTDKGLPRYDDAAESDVFLLSGAEDLVPVPRQDRRREGFTVRRYRPRIEGLFALIERWTRDADGDVHWRSISRDNILTLYGKDAASRIADPADPLRVFSWLMCESRDDKGNAVLYDYKAEDGAGIDTARACERNRGGRNDARRAANRYPRRIRYGNRVPLLDGAGKRPRVLGAAQLGNAGWMFELVFDYGEHGAAAPAPDDAGMWICRGDAFSSWRPGFEVRTSRLCQRVLLFHHFPEEADVGAGCLVRSTDFGYSHQRDPADSRNPVYTFLLAVTQSGYVRDGAGYRKRSLPPVEYQYTEPSVQDTVQEVDAQSLANLPAGVDGALYQWTDLHGEGIPGILSEQAGAWFYQRNISPISERPVEFEPLELVAEKPNTALGGGARFMDLAGDGQPDLVVLDGPMPGLYEHDDAQGWQPYRPFTARLNRDTRDPNLKFVDLDGDGLADVLVSEQDAFVWHASLAEQGFGPGRRLAQALDEEQGPRLVFADGSESIYLADMSGDGLTDLVRIRNGEVCYWPNLGYGRFGARVAMDCAPAFDQPDQFEQRRIRLADIDGSGTTDLIYLHRDGVRLYFNRCGNGWGAAHQLRAFPPVDEVASIAASDLFGNGTACLVWSSPLSGHARRQLRYVDLMGGQKPHLLAMTANNLGAETRIHYAPSTRFYLQDRRAGRPWSTRLPFPVHVVERVETFDRISRNRFVTRYGYHDGCFDGGEREFRGFGMVEQWDTEHLTALGGGPEAANLDPGSQLPPVLTRTWFHTGVQVGDTLLGAGLTPEEEREACRALKGAMLRQEVYALDGSARESSPYTVAVQTFAARLLQPREGNRHAVFLTHPLEAITHHLERNPGDPRTQHTFTLEVDDHGNVLKQAAAGYGRRPGLGSLHGQDRDKQEQLLVTYTENSFTNAVVGDADHLAPLPAEARTYEVTGMRRAGDSSPFSAAELLADCGAAAPLDYEAAPTPGRRQKRLIEHVRTLYRSNDLSGLLAPGRLESLALPGESYRLAFTPGLARQVYVARGKLAASALDGVLSGEGGYVHSQGDAQWWVPSGRVFLSPRGSDSPAQELAHAQAHFFLPQRMRDPFHTASVSTESFAGYDGYDLLLAETRDALGNTVRVEANDYRVLQPRLVSDANRNRSAVAFDALGMVAATAVMGKAAPAPAEGDSIEGFAADLTDAAIADYFEAPLAGPHALLGRASKRLVYDLFAYHRSREQAQPQPVAVATLARETHEAELAPGQRTRVQHSFSYSDGFGREVQKKLQAEPGPLAEGGLPASPRWVGSGWTIFNNKGKPVRQYEPFFSATHGYQIGVLAGVSPVLFYDPLGRAVVTLHPNDTYEKIVFDPWQQTSWDVNDTVAPRNAQTGDPRTDADIGGCVAGYFAALPAAAPGPWQTWYQQRQAPGANAGERAAADKAAAHADTPVIAHFDALGRPFLTVASNRVACAGHPLDGTQELLATRTELDIEGNQLAVRDANKKSVDSAGNAVVDLGHVVMRYAHDMLGNRIHQASMEAGARWMLGDVAGKPIRSWDSRGHGFVTGYDALRRPVTQRVRGRTAQSDPRTLNRDVLVDQVEYGEAVADALALNLRTRVYRHLDSAGVTTSAAPNPASGRLEAYDFKGNPLRSARRFASDYKAIADWSLAPVLDDDTFVSGTRYDALNRPVQTIAPHSAAAAAPCNVIQPVFNEANLLERLDLWLGRAGEPPGVLDPATDAPSPEVGIADIDYDAKGQRIWILYRNEASTSFEHDPLTFRLTRIISTRPTGAGALAAQLFRNEATVQDLRYCHDPVGNITHVTDHALPTVVHGQQRVAAACGYVYDALYRLVEGTGREHVGQSALLLNPPNGNYRDHPFVGGRQLADPRAVRNYTEQYVYDAVGNFDRVIHRATGGGWTRAYSYLEASLLEPGKQSNRLSGTTIGGTPEQYSANGDGYDPHGNMLRMPQLRRMEWDCRDQLRQVDLGGGGTAWYVYDATGQRVRKVCEKAPGLVEERIYLGGAEIFRRHGGAIGAGSTTLERETLHVMDDRQRIALVETRTLGSDPAPQQLVRYQLGNHLGSASLELDHQAGVVSYEEYTPYGCTSYQAARSQTDTAKRYRCTGKERDEESGLDYYGARYYAAWLGRWTACDTVINPNRYTFVHCRPTTDRDVGGLESNRQLMGVDDASVDAALQQDPSLSNVLKLTAKQSAYDAWNVLTAGFVSKHDTLFEARSEGKISDSEYWTKTTGEASKSLLVATVSAVTGGAGGAGAKTLAGAIVRGAGSGAASGAATNLIEQGADLALGNKEDISMKELAVSAGSGALFGAVGGAVEWKLKRPGAPPPTKIDPGTRKGSAKPGPDEALVGSSTAQMRREAAKAIAADADHPLQFLLDESGSFKPQKGMKHHELMDRPDIVQMGHIESNKIGGQERVMLQGGWENQFNNVTIEGPRVRGGVLDQPAIDIGGIAVDLKTAMSWESFGMLKPGTVEGAPRIVF